MGLKDLTYDAVTKALAEFDALTRGPFLSKYEFGPSTRYFIEHEGRLYDSKAVAGAAHQHLGIERRPLAHEQFSGGEWTVKRKLERLGFRVVAKPATRLRNPDWTRDELILALDLYLSNPAAPPGKESREVAELSRTLRVLGERLGNVVAEDYRNPNGVYMKMMNFRRFDPAFVADGRVGLRRGNREEASVWAKYSDNRPLLTQVVGAIRSALRDGEECTAVDLDEGEMEAEEGRILTAVHKKRERSAKIVKKRKEVELRRSGRLACEACGFDFQQRYGRRGQGFIEAHHTKAVHSLVPGEKTRLADLALVCANCHRMIHSARPWLKVEKLREIITLASREGPNVAVAKPQALATDPPWADPGSPTTR